MQCPSCHTHTHYYVYMLYPPPTRIELWYPLRGQKFGSLEVWTFGRTLLHRNSVQVAEHVPLQLKPDP